jgi:hypothetical protein
MLVVLIAVGPFVSLAEPLDTYHQGWSLVRETANEDGANFAAVYDLTGGAGTSNFAGKDSSSVLNGGPFHIRPTGFPVPVSPGSRWQFVICGEARNGADDTFSFDVVGWAAGNGMLQKIVEGDGVLGTQTVVTYPDDGADAVGATVGVTGVTFDLAGGSLAKLFTDTSDTGSFDGAVVGMMAYVTGTNITDGIYDVNGVTDAIAYAGKAETTGIFARNLWGANTTSIAAAVTGTDAMYCWENYTTGALNASGIIDPAVDAD